jgi:Tfp pilus assembly protein PilN
MRAVNLLPTEQKQRSPRNKLVLAGVTSSSAVLMLLGAGYLNASSTVSDREQSLANLKAQLAAIPKPRSTGNASYDALLASERVGRLSALSSALSGRVRFDRLLRELAIVLPEDVWLQQLTASAPKPLLVAPTSTGSPAPSAPVTGGATTFSIQGNTYTQEGVARLLIRLQLVPDLENVTLATSVLEDVGGQKKVQFTINADVKAPQVGS